jgi:hypothetical protein
MRIYPKYLYSVLSKPQCCNVKEKFVIEIGGKGKGREQFKGIKIEKKLILSDDPKAGRGKKPLSLLGFIK